MSTNNGHAAGTTDENALLDSESSGHLKCFGIADHLVTIGETGIVGFRPEVLTDSLDEVRRDVIVGLCRVDRSLRVNTHDNETGFLLLQILGAPRYRPAGSDASDEYVDPAIGLLPYLRSGRQYVCLGIRGIRVLVRLIVVRPT